MSLARNQQCRLNQAGQPYAFAIESRIAHFFLHFCEWFCRALTVVPRRDRVHFGMSKVALLLHGNATVCKHELRNRGWGVAVKNYVQPGCTLECWDISYLFRHRCVSKFDSFGGAEGWFFGLDSGIVPTYAIGSDCKGKRFHSKNRKANLLCM